MDMQTPPIDLVLNITAVAYGGRGISRVDGKVYFVQDAVPGDNVRVRITEAKERYCTAEIVEFVTRSPLRTPAPCPYLESCGGCQWMEIDYANQLAWKKEFIQSALSRIGKISADLPVVVRPSPKQLGYRNRVLLRAHIDSNSRMICGYFMRGSRNLVAINRCEIACEPVNEFIKHLLSTSLLPVSNIKIRIEIQELPHGSGKVCVTVYPGDGERAATKEFLNIVKTLPNVSWAGLVFDLPDAPAQLFDHQNNRDYLTIPGQFQQINIAHNHNLRDYILATVGKKNPRRILDVFCGSGNISLGLVDGNRYVEGVEANKVAISCAGENLRINGLSDAVYVAGDAEKHLLNCARNGEKFDLVILDPPRMGFRKGMAPLKRMQPKTIIYVSCDPSTLARDIGFLCQNGEYLIESVTGFDFFPNTFHVETVAVLSRS